VPALPAGTGHVRSGVRFALPGSCATIEEKRPLINGPGTHNRIVRTLPEERASRSMCQQQAREICAGSRSRFHVTITVNSDREVGGADRI